MPPALPVIALQSVTPILPVLHHMQYAALPGSIFLPDPTLCCSAVDNLVILAHLMCVLVSPSGQQRSVLSSQARLTRLSASGLAGWPTAQQHKS